MPLLVLRIIGSVPFECATVTLSKKAINRTSRLGIEKGLRSLSSYSLTNLAEDTAMLVLDVTSKGNRHLLSHGV